MSISKRTRIRDACGNLHDTATGQFVSDSGSLWKQPRGKRIQRLQETARRESYKVDRVDKRLRFAEQTNGWWFIPPQAGGTRNWVRQKTTPTMIRGFYYQPDNWCPVVPPRDTWSSQTQYHGIPGRTPVSHFVPDDVWEAAHIFRGDRAEERARKHGGNETTPLRRVAAMRRSERPIKRATRRIGSKKTTVTKSVPRKPRRAE